MINQPVAAKKAEQIKVIRIRKSLHQKLKIQAALKDMKLQEYAEYLLEKSFANAV